TSFPRVSWLIPTLPYIEQDNLRTNYNINLSWGAAVNLPIGAQRIKILQCPSSPNPERQDGDPQTNAWNIIAGTDHAASTSVAAGGNNVNPTGAPQPGILQKNKFPGNRIADVSDGLSNTIAITESAGRPQIYRLGKPYGSPTAQQINGGGWARPA